MLKNLINCKKVNIYKSEQNSKSIKKLIILSKNWI